MGLEYRSGTRVRLPIRVRGREGGEGGAGLLDAQERRCRLQADPPAARVVELGHQRDIGEGADLEAWFLSVT